jgi:TolA-binding protein
MAWFRFDCGFDLKDALYYDHVRLQGGDMAEAQHSHRHPDYDQRIGALEEQIKKMQKEIQDLRHKLEPTITRTRTERTDTARTTGVSFR